MSGTSSALLIASTAEDSGHAGACLAGWSLEAVAPDDVGALVSYSRAPSVVLFHARGDEESASKVVKLLRSNSVLMEVPILLIIDRYEIGLRNVIEEVPYTLFIIAPYTATELHAGLDALLRASTP